jgi:hypothetical protein
MAQLSRTLGWQSDPSDGASSKAFMHSSLTVEWNQSMEHEVFFSYGRNQLDGLGISVHLLSYPA